MKASWMGSYRSFPTYLYLASSHMQPLAVILTVNITTIFSCFVSCSMEIIKPEEIVGIPKTRQKWRWCGGPKVEAGIWNENRMNYFLTSEVCLTLGVCVKNLSCSPPKFFSVKEFIDKIHLRQKRKLASLKELVYNYSLSSSIHFK